MSTLEWTFVAMGVGAGTAFAWTCGVILWRLLRGPRS